MQTMWFPGTHGSLPLTSRLLFLGPVKDFVDIAIFVSRDMESSADLAALFDSRSKDPGFVDAVRELRSPDGVTEIPWVNAVTASAVLTRMAQDLILEVASTARGLYRTSFQARDRFGVGRHPAQEMYRTQELAFSLQIEVVE
ncbi:MAG: hypothetical protein M3Y30_03965 [Gemmatimonadota bacterium]|nr:hypothetical protein [Gemmatimonadota bacterium]